MQRVAPGSFAARGFGAMDPAVQAALIQGATTLATTTVATVAANSGGGGRSGGTRKRKKETTPPPAAPPPVAREIPWGPLALGAAALVAVVLVGGRREPVRSVVSYEAPRANPRKGGRRGR